jgi:hypothetical protein
MPVLFRTYQTVDDDMVYCPIWQAAHATSALPSFLKPVVVGPSGSCQSYVDGGIGFQNPALQVLREAESIFPGQEVACFISIGSGRRAPISISKPTFIERILPIHLVKAMASICVDCEATSQAMVLCFRKTPDVYFRFNVDQGLQEISFAQWDQLEKVKAHTRYYLRSQEIDHRITDAVDATLRHQSRNAEASTTQGMPRSRY